MAKLHRAMQGQESSLCGGHEYRTLVTISECYVSRRKAHVEVMCVEVTGSTCLRHSALMSLLLQMIMLMIHCETDGGLVECFWYPSWGWSARMRQVATAPLEHPRSFSLCKDSSPSIETTAEKEL